MTVRSELVRGKWLHFLNMRHAVKGARGSMYIGKIAKT